MLSWWLPETFATSAGRHAGLLHLAYWTIGVGMVVGQIVALRAAWRARIAAPSGRDTLVLEAIWAIVPVLMLLVLGLLSTLAGKAA